MQDQETLTMQRKSRRPLIISTIYQFLSIYNVVLTLKSKFFSVIITCTSLITAIVEVKTVTSIRPVINTLINPQLDATNQYLVALVQSLFNIKASQATAAIFICFVIASAGLRLLHNFISGRLTAK